MCCFYIIAKGTKRINAMWGFDAEGEDLWLLCTFSLGAGLIAAGLSWFVRPTIRRAIDETPEEEPEPVKPAQLATDIPDEESKAGGALGWLRKMLDTNTEDIVARSEMVTNIHNQAERFPRKTEVVFRYMQIMTATFDSFAHGANDVANAVGPYAAVRCL